MLEDRFLMMMHRNGTVSKTSSRASNVSMIDIIVAITI